MPFFIPFSLLKTHILCLGCIFSLSILLTQSLSSLLNWPGSVYSVAWGKLWPRGSLRFLGSSSMEPSAFFPSHKEISLVVFKILLCGFYILKSLHMWRNSINTKVYPFKNKILPFPPLHQLHISEVKAIHILGLSFQIFFLLYTHISFLFLPTQHSQGRI